MFVRMFFIKTLPEKFKQTSIALCLIIFNTLDASKAHDSNGVCRGRKKRIETSFRILCNKDIVVVCYSEGRCLLLG